MIDMVFGPISLEKRKTTFLDIFTCFPLSGCDGILRPIESQYRMNLIHKSQYPPKSIPLMGFFLLPDWKSNERNSCCRGDCCAGNDLHEVSSANHLPPLLLASIRLSPSLNFPVLMLYTAYTDKSRSQYAGFVLWGVNWEPKELKGLTRKIPFVAQGYHCWDFTWDFTLTQNPPFFIVR